MVKYTATKYQERIMAGIDDVFTPQARGVLENALTHAQELNHHYVGTEHLLIALAEETTGVAHEALVNLDADPAKIKHSVLFIVGRGDRKPPLGQKLSDIMTPRGKKVIELAAEEEKELRLPGQNQRIGSEHLLIGLVKEGDGIAAGVLESVGINYSRIKAEVTHLLYPRSIDNDVDSDTGNNDATNDPALIAKRVSEIESTIKSLDLKIEDLKREKARLLANTQTTP
jgi:ATP-dependent Clp protease ATP-binding subunit ClpC